MEAAAFGRLCVETVTLCAAGRVGGTAAFGRLCVETEIWADSWHDCPQPPSGGCVLKPAYHSHAIHSRGPAAFGRLCVETRVSQPCNTFARPSRLRAAVC